MADAAVRFLYRMEKSNDNLFHMAQRLFALVYIGKRNTLKCFISAKSKHFQYCIYYT